MKRIALVLVLAACGGEDANLAAHAGGMCQTYEPSPEALPGETVTTCVPADWSDERFCWRTNDEIGCDEFGMVTIGCVDPRAGTPEVEILCTTNLRQGCGAGMIDNHECCGGSHSPAGLETWGCDWPE